MNGKGLKNKPGWNCNEYHAEKISKRDLLRLRVLKNEDLIIFFAGIIFFGLTLTFTQTRAQEKSKIKIIHSDQLKFDKKISPDLSRLIGNVVLRHDSILMYSDSAYFYQARNEFYAFGSVKMDQGDTLFLYGDSLYYNGNHRKGRVRSNVHLTDDDMSLSTDFLDFDTENNISYFSHGGTILDSSNTLTSDRGFYFANTKDFVFGGNVKISTPDYLIESDTMAYNSQNGKATFLGPSEITGDSSYIKCEHGFYDTESDIAQLGLHSLVQNKEYTLKADSIFYNQKLGKGLAWRNIELHDTINQFIIKGNYGQLHRMSNRAFITDSALLIQYENYDSMYVHADTLFSMSDTSGNYRILKAYHHVRFYKYEIQGKCDSLSYSSSDSLIRLFSDPILWNEQNQLTADEIKIHIKNNKANRIYMDQSAFIISQEDSIHFNQIFGKKMVGFINNNSLYKINVEGNATTIYFPKEEEDLIGANKTESSNLNIILFDGQIKKIIPITNPEGFMKPLKDTKKEEIFLKGFAWYQKLRPKSVSDLFRITD